MKTFVQINTICLCFPIPYYIYKALQGGRNTFLRNIFLQSKQKKMQFLCAVSKKVCNFAAAKEVCMCSLERFNIDLKALTEDVMPLEWELDDQYFSALDGAEVQGGALHVSGSIRKAVGFYELQLAISGTVRIPCDRCLDPMDQPIETELQLVVKLGSEYSEQDDIIVVDESEGTLDTSWFIYEAIALAIPIQHVHQPGDCNVAMSEKLKELSAARSSNEDAEKAVDPRWEALLKLKMKGEE